VLLREGQDKGKGKDKLALNGVEGGGGGLIKEISFEWRLCILVRDTGDKEGRRGGTKESEEGE
jgi:hypothetical protein